MAWLLEWVTVPEDLCAALRRGVQGAEQTGGLFDPGLHLYVDDLVTDGEERSRGNGARLLGWLRERARTEGCRTLELDSGTHRTRAHRFYFREGMHISSFHFRQELPSPPERGPG